MGREHFLNVTELEAPAPLQIVLSELETLSEGDYLRLLIKREPILLYPLLLIQGFEHETSSRSPENYEVLIWNKGDRAAERAAHGE